MQKNTKYKMNTINKACKYYPCHKNLESCVFCYCPFYPCQDLEHGEYVLNSSNKEGIWSCSECEWIHQKKIVDEIFDIIKKNYEINSTN